MNLKFSVSVVHYLNKLIVINKVTFAFFRIDSSSAGWFGFG